MGAIKHIPYTHRETYRPIGGDSGNLEAKHQISNNFVAKYGFNHRHFEYRMIPFDRGYMKMLTDILRF